jgi:hypothetical protein
VLLASVEARSEPRPIKDNRFSIDLFQGPILAPIDVTGIAGAYAAYAEGIPGMVTNAASPAVREAYSVKYLDMDGSGSVSIPVSLFENNDFDNSGSLDYDYSNFLYFTLGGMLRYGPIGIGFSAELQRYTLTDKRFRTTNVTVGKYHMLGAGRLLGDQLIVGAGLRFATLGLEAETNLTMFGGAPEFGFLVRPDWQSFRIGGTLRLPVEGGPLLGAVAIGDDGVRRAGGLVLPNNVVLPWELEVGMAVQVGPRPLNPVWVDPHVQEREVHASFAARRTARRDGIEGELGRIEDLVARVARRKELLREEEQHAARDAVEEEKALKALQAGRRARFLNWPREHLLLTAELLVTGPVRDGVSVQGFLGQYFGTERGANLVGSAGATVNFSPRFGVEGEPIPDRVHTRLGSYYEPYRFGQRVGRQHFTFGADVKLFGTTWFGLFPELLYKLQASADLAPRYQSFSLGAGAWN